MTGKIHGSMITQGQNPTCLVPWFNRNSGPNLFISNMTAVVCVDEGCFEQPELDSGDG